MTGFDAGDLRLLLHPIPAPSPPPISHCTIRPRRPKPFDWQASGDPLVVDDERDRPL